ncbi:hypothetical protein FKM82_018301 [Ascaphus truei]
MTRLGSSLAPLVMLLEDVWVFLPPVIFSSMSLLSGAAAFLLAETSHTQLPETIQDVELNRYRNPTADTNGDLSVCTEDRPACTVSPPDNTTNNATHTFSGTKTSSPAACDTCHAGNAPPSDHAHEFPGGVVILRNSAPPGLPFSNASSEPPDGDFHKDRCADTSS